MIVETSVGNGVAQWPGNMPPADDACPLYIAPVGETWVELDGPALKIVQIEKAERLYPLRRLSRIFVQRRVEWSTEALLACAERGIIVVFIDDDGEVTGRLLGRPGERDELYQRLSDFLLLPQAQGMYRWWREDTRRRAANWAGAKLGLSRPLRNPRSCREWINREARRCADEKAAIRTGQWMRSLAYDWMEKHLQDLGFGRQNELGRSGEPALARDLTEILMWYLEPVRIGWLQRRQLAAKRKGQALRAPSRKEMVRLFESHVARVSVRGREITSLLHRWLIHNGE